MTTGVTKVAAAPCILLTVLFNTVELSSPVTCRAPDQGGQAKHGKVDPAKAHRHLVLVIVTLPLSGSDMLSQQCIGADQGMQLIC